MKKALPAMFLLFIVISLNSAFAQAPTISYSSPKTFVAGTAIIPLSPTSSGVAAPAYNNNPVIFGGFGLPESVAVDGAGNVYAGVFAGDTVRAVYKVPAGGGAPIILGTFFASPSSSIAIAADKVGDVYVSVEAGTNGGVYKIPAAGGSPVSIGNVVGLPTGIAVDGMGNVYVADHINHIVSEIIANGGATIRLPSDAATSNPISIAADVAGNVYIGDSFGSNNANGVYEILAGGGEVAIFTRSDLEPVGIATDGAGNVYIANVSGDVYKVPAGGGSQVSVASGYPFVNAVAVDGSGNVYLSDSTQGVNEFKPVGGCYIGPGLPAGLSFDNATGIISGTPTAGSSATNYTVTAYNSYGSTSAALNLMVKPTISYSSPKTYTAGATIVPLTPTANGVAAYGYGGPVAFGNNPYDEPGIAVDPAGNVYVSVDNSDTSSIEKIPAGGGPATTIATGFAGPTGIAVDASGNVYAASRGFDLHGNSFITKLPAGGGAPVIIGSGFSMPACVAVDAAGNVFVGDVGDKTLKEIPVNGGATVTISSGYNYYGVAVDATGNVYFVDPDGAPGVFKIPAGGGAPVGIGYVATDQGSNYQVGIALDASGNVYVATYDLVFEFPAGGGPANVVLKAQNSKVTNTHYGSSNGAFLQGIAVDANGNMFITDETFVVKMQPVGGYSINTPLPAGLMFNNITGTISGKPTAASPATNYTVTAYGGTVTNTATVNIKVNLPALPTISYSGPQTYTQGTAISALAPIATGVAVPGYNPVPVTIGSGFNSPKGVATDAAGNVYVADQTNSKVDKIPAGGGAPISIGSGFNRPSGVAVDGAGNVYVTDPNDGILYKIPAGGGSTVTVASGFGDPTGVAVDGAGNIYVSDENRSAIMKLPAGGGAAVSIGSGFNFPTNVAVDGAGNIYVADAGNKAIKKIPAAGGPVTTIATGYNALFGIAVDGAGNLFVSDDGNNVIKELPASGGAPITISNAINGPAGIAVDGAGNIYEADGNDFFQVYTLKEFKPVGGYYINPFLPAGLSFNSRTGVISGTAKTGSAATNYIITGYNSGGGVAASLNINVRSTNASLSSLKTSDGTLSPAFAAATTSYTVSVGNGVASITVTSILSDTTATVKVNGVLVTSGIASAAIPLSFGLNNITTVVTAQDGVTTKTYTVTVNRVASTNANLANLHLSVGTLSPAFAGATTTSYTASVAGTVSSITLTPTTAQTTSTVTVNSSPVASGTASGPIALTPGLNTIQVVVTAQDGIAKKTYTITVGQGSTNANLSSLKLSSGILSPSFAGAVTADYTASVPNSVSGIMVTPTTAQTTSTVTVNGTAVTSGGVSGAIALNVGANTITAIVTAQNGLTTKTYTVTVTRAPSSDASLSAISTSSGTLSPAFSSAVTSYSAMVTNGTGFIKITPTTTDATATVTVNGTAVVSGNASPAITLVVGNNVISTVVTAQDGTTMQTYTLNVLRPSANANLSGLHLSGGAVLSPAFAGVGTTSYTASVAHSIISITATPTTAQTTSTVKVNGTAVTSGSPSGAIALSVGANTITAVVTAQDGITTKTYTVTVTRAAGPVNIPDVSAGVEKQEGPQLADDGIIVHAGLSPNGDGVNDFLKIDGITNYPDNKLTIMNRNGTLIYGAKNYDNQTKTFDGHSTKTGAMQLPGTYFYSLEYKVKGVTRRKTGFIILKY